MWDKVKDVHTEWRSSRATSLDQTRHTVVHRDHKVVGLLARPPRWRLLHVLLLLLLLHGLRVLHRLRRTLHKHRPLHHVGASGGVW